LHANLYLEELRKPALRRTTTTTTIIIIIIIERKEGKGRPRTGHEGPVGE
jgi:hypothetical protein